jgi:hypothetical protein
MILFFISGSFSALFAIIAELVAFSFLTPSGVGIDPWNLNNIGIPFSVILMTLAVVAVIEESLKFLVLARQTVRATEASTDWLRFVVFGIGFTVTEIAFASISSGNGSLIPIGAMAGLLVLHVLTAFLYGKAVGSRRNRLRLIYAVGILIHLSYDILLALA